MISSLSVSDELSTLDAVAQTELVAKKGVRPIELGDAAIERLDKLNPIQCRYENIKLCNTRRPSDPNTRDSKRRCG